MKKLLFIALLLTSTAAMAQNAPPAAQGAMADRQEHREQKFAEHKAKILEHISQRIAEAQKNQACVQAAKDIEALRACRPEKGRGRGGFGGHRGPDGGEQGPPG